MPCRARETAEQTSNGKRKLVLPSMALLSAKKGTPKVKVKVDPDVIAGETQLSSHDATSESKAESSLQRSDNISDRSSRLSVQQNGVPKKPTQPTVKDRSGEVCSAENLS